MDLEAQNKTPPAPIKDCAARIYANYIYIFQKHH